MEGQKKIRELWKLEVNTRKRLEKEKQTLVDSLEGTTKFSLVTDENDDNIGDNGIFIKSKFLNYRSLIIMLYYQRNCQQASQHCAFTKLVSCHDFFFKFYLMALFLETNMK